MTEDELNIYDLDLGDPLAVDIPLSFVLNDFRNLDTRNGTFSKTITIPSTKVNDSLLAHSFDINAEGFFDRNLKKKFRMERFGIRLMKGYFQLKEVLMENGYVIGYEIVLFSNNSEWFTSLEGLTLRDLDLGTHNFNVTNFINSWANNGDSSAAYVYPFVDFGALTTKTNTDLIYVDYFITGIFIKQILKKIFRNIDYEIDTIFFKKQQFRDLILISPNDFKINDEQIASRSFNVGLMLDYSRSVHSVDAPQSRTDTIPFNDETSTGFFDGGTLPYNYDSVTNFRWDVQYTGKYTITSHIELSFTITPEPTYGSWRGIDFGTKPTVQCRIRKNGTTTIVSQSIQTSILTADQTSVYYTADYIENMTFHLVRNDYTLTAGDYVEVEILLANNDIVFQDISGITINMDEIATIEHETSYFKNEPSPKIIEGSDIELAKILPNISQRDFIKYIVTNFNLIINTDNNAKQISIETRNDFYYDIFNSEDWTEKQDHLFEERIVQIEEGINRTLSWTYKVDSNDDNIVRHNNTFKTEFGRQKILLKNEFLEGEKKIASLPYSLSFNSYSFSTSGISLYMPQLINADAIVDDIADGGYGMSLNFEPRIFIYDGLVTPVNPSAINLFNLSGAAATQLSYPFCYSTKEISTIHDISLAFCNFKDVSLTIQTNDKGLYDRFYADQIRQLNFGRLYVAYFRITETDILNLDFRKPKLLNINGNKTYFHLNKMNDFLAGKDDSTEVELIQIPFGYGDNSE